MTYGEKQTFGGEAVVGKSAAEHQFRVALRDRGLRVTPNRLKVFRTLIAHPEPLTSAQLAEILADDGMNPATVYRMMEQFTEAGIVHPVVLGHKRVGYEVMGEHRSHLDHFFCIRCHRMFDVPECGLDAALTELADRIGFEIAFHHADIHGLCPDCLRADGTPEGSADKH